MRGAGALAFIGASQIKTQCFGNLLKQAASKYRKLGRAPC